jgi:hypothetical protein
VSNAPNFYTQGFLMASRRYGRYLRAGMPVITVNIFYLYKLSNMRKLLLFFCNWPAGPFAAGAVLVTTALGTCRLAGFPGYATLSSRYFIDHFKMKIA